MFEARDVRAAPIYYYILTEDGGPAVIRYQDGQVALLLFSVRDAAEKIMDLLPFARRLRTTDARGAPNLAAKFFGRNCRHYILDLEPESLDDKGNTADDYCVYHWPLTRESLEGVVR